MRISICKLKSPLRCQRFLSPVLPYNSLSPEARRAYKDKNWEQILDISFFESKWIRRGYMIQATFWELRTDMIRDVRFFRTSQYKSKPLASDDNLPGQIG